MPRPALAQRRRGRPAAIGRLFREATGEDGNALFRPFAPFILPGPEGECDGRVSACLPVPLGCFQRPRQPPLSSHCSEASQGVGGLGVVPPISHL